MSGLSSFVISVAAIAAVSFLSYRGACEKAVRAALSVLLLAAILLPVYGKIRDFAGESFDFRTPQVTDGTYLEVGEASFCRGVLLEISSRFSLREDDLIVRAEDFCFEKMRAGKITVTLKNRAAFADATAIRSFVESSGLGNCEVDLEIG